MRRAFESPWARAVLVAAAGIVFLVAAGHGPPMCQLRFLLGIPCPGCGLTRSAIALAHLDFAGAWRYHPLGFLIVPFLAALGADASWRFVRTGRFTTRLGGKFPAWAGVALLVLLAGVWIARLAGQLGGAADPIDLRAGLVGKALALVVR